MARCEGKDQAVTHALPSRTTASASLVDVARPSEVDSQVSLPGPPIPPQQRIHFYSADEWEDFIREWATGLTTEYTQIKRFGGPGDKGADIAAFKSDAGLEGPWDCFQGKHYANPLAFGDAAPEILKVFRAVINGAYVMPESYRFLAPKGCGTALNKLLSQPTKLRAKFIERLSVGDPLMRGLDQSQIDVLRELATVTDFARFKSVELLEAIEVHRGTPYHAARFGTALTPRSANGEPPPDVAEHETRYVEQLVAVYSERYPGRSFDLRSLAADSNVGSHFQRQRETFYKAESLRLYARDSVPPETFEKLQADIHSGVIDIAEADHPSGWSRLASVLTSVGQLDLQHHRLIAVSDINDRKGICHQLANDDHLTWVREA